MKRLACVKFAMAAVSVISKQILRPPMPLRWNCSITYGRNLSSPRLWPDRLIEHIESRRRSSASDTSQRSIDRGDAVALGRGDELSSHGRLPACS
jgi:hypothetical protein